MDKISNIIPVDLNPPQLDAVKHTEGPLLILAGAGSGKTRVLACRAAYLVHSGIAKPYQILALTFTNKAAAELRSRAAAMVGEEGSFVYTGTFHSIFARLMRIEGLNIGIDPNFTIVDTDDRHRLIKAILKELNVNNSQSRPKVIEWMISAAKNALLDPEGYAEQAVQPLQSVTAEVYRIYEKRLRRMNGMDFDDLLIRPIELFKQYPDFLQRLQNRFRWVMIDEFQDTNRPQYLLAYNIALKHRNLCVVGDDDQAIYGWRGATVKNILEFQEDWHETRVIRLEQNYRSTRPILDSAWSVIRNNPDRHPKKLWTDRTDGDKVKVIVSYNEEAEAQRFVSAIQDLQHQKGYERDKFAILYRTNAQSLPFERALRATQIPYHVVGGLRFYERKAVKDVLAYLRFLVNPADDISLQRIINYPPRGIGNNLAGEINAEARTRSVSMNQAIGIVSGKLKSTSRSGKALDAFIRLIAELRETAEQSTFPQLVTEIIRLTGLKERFIDEEKDDPSRAESKLANLDSLVTEITRYAEMNPKGSINDFLEEVSLVTDADDIDLDQDRVNLLTLHSAKGLEFPVVLIGGLEEGILPLSPPDGSQCNTQEERRLFYVGATRAMDNLVLGYCRNRSRWGTSQYNEPSRFLSEIDPELLDGMEVKPPPRTVSSTAPIRKSRSQTSTKSPEPDFDYDSLQRGQLVTHPKFGLGVITDFTRRGADSTVKVDFDDVGMKTLVLRYARLEVTR